jgi:hypothetical protein
VRRLRGCPEGEFTGRRLVACDSAAGFHRGRNEALVNDLLAHHHFGSSDGCIGFRLIARLPLHHDIVRRIFVELRRTRLGGFLCIDHDRQRFVLHLDQVTGVACDVAIFGDHQRHRITREMHLADRQNAGSVDIILHPTRLPGARQRIQIEHVFASKHGNDARMSFRFARINRLDLCVGVRAAQHTRMRHAGEFDVIEECALSRNQPRIFAALDSLTHQFRRHRFSRHCCFSLLVRRNQKSNDRCNHPHLTGATYAGTSSLRIFAAAYCTARTML